MTCPLCTNSQINHYHTDSRRSYWHCLTCDLVFVDPAQRLTKEQEKAIYDLHENAPEDLGYRRFLNKLLIPLQHKLADKAHGLDFGCGPGPTVSLIMHNQGFTMSNYDLFYYPDSKALTKSYDFITCTEVIEHLHKPHVEFDLLDQLLKPGGILGIMTKRVLNRDAFSKWHYKNDQTHVCFYSEITFQWIANRWGYEFEFPGNDTVLLTKKA